MAQGTKFPAWIRHSGAGLELAGATAGLALAGYWMDGRFDTGPWGLLVGVFIGIVGGLYNLVKEAIQAQRDAGQESGDQSGKAR
jgi:F0F1-type ATP synthase assembly protein I